MVVFQFLIFMNALYWFSHFLFIICEIVELVELVDFNEGNVELVELNQPGDVVEIDIDEYFPKLEDPTGKFSEQFDKYRLKDTLNNEPSYLFF